MMKTSSLMLIHLACVAQDKNPADWLGHESFALVGIPLATKLAVPSKAVCKAHCHVHGPQILNEAWDSLCLAF